MNVCRICGHRDHGSGIDYDAGGNKYVDPCGCDEGGCPCEGDPGWSGGTFLLRIGVPLPKRVQSIMALYVDFETWLLRYQSVLGSEDKAWEWMARAARDYMDAYYVDGAGPVTLGEYRERRYRQLAAVGAP